MLIKEKKGPINQYVTLYFVGGKNDFGDVAEKNVQKLIESLSNARELDETGKVLWEFGNVKYLKELGELQSTFLMIMPREITTRDGTEIIEEVEQVEVHIRLKTGIVEIRKGIPSICEECISRVAQGLFGDPKYFNRIMFNDLDFEKLLSMFAETTGTRLDHLWHAHFDEVGFTGSDVTRATEYHVYRDSGGKIKVISGVMPLPSKRVVSLGVFRWGRLRFSFVDKIDWGIIEETIEVMEKILA